MADRSVIISCLRLAQVNFSCMNFHSAISSCSFNPEKQNVKTEQSIFFLVLGDSQSDFGFT